MQAGGWVLFATKRSRLSDHAAERIRLLIEEQGIAPGSRLPSERELSRQLGVGRTSVREGLRTLEMIGLIETVPSKGVYLREGTAGPLDKLITSWLSIHKGTVHDLIELREAVETQAACLAANRAAPPLIASMEQAVIAMRWAKDAEDAERFVDADTAFHDAVAEASGNALLRRALASIAREIVTFRMATALLGQTVLERSLADHERVLSAIKARDASAAGAAMREHIVRTPHDLHVADGRFEDSTQPHDDGEAV